MLDLLRIEFQGQEYLFIGSDIQTGGAIATEEQFRMGMRSHAHLYKDGLVKRAGEVIGHADDIRVIGEKKLSLDDPLCALANLGSLPSWRVNRARTVLGG